jgi:fatty-acyl-CoA synthase
MLGMMQDWQLRVEHLIDHAAREHGTREIYTKWADGSESRSNWAEVRRDSMRLARARERLGIRRGDRVASVAMNHAHHLASWYGVPGAGAILHTLNPRLFADQLEFIVNHAEDRVLFYDAPFRPLVEKMKPFWPGIEHYICYDNGEFRSLIEAEDTDFEWELGDEQDACMLCYTSGTTGDPKGVLYSHRSSMLHAMAVVQPSMFDLSPGSAMLPVVPMFHAAGWGLPWACAASGCKMVFATSYEPVNLVEMMNAEGVTHSAGVPTVWLGLLQYLEASDEKLKTLEQVQIGGSAAPRMVVEKFMKMGLRVMHAWGMTETSPVGTAGGEPLGWEEMSFDEQVAAKLPQGRALFGIEMRTVSLDDPAKELPRDGKSAGALQVRGPWVVKRYYKAEQDAVGEGQWFETGDVGIVHPDGTLQLTDRTKDVIKSGGEWISSVELENAAVGHPAVAEAAAIGIPDPKWDERPLLVVVLKEGRELTSDGMREFLREKVAKWWIPERIEFAAEIPHTATGKISKKTLREHFC